MSRGGPSHAETVTWLRLARTPGIGPVGFARLIARYGTAEAALDALPGRFRNAGKPVPAIPARERAEAEIEAVERAGARLLTALDPDFPPFLAAIPAAPPVLIAKGDAGLAARPCCAMVGARNASAAGLRFARELARGLGAEDVTVVSGLARGIDGAAHAGALDTGTIAVLAGGIDYIYPPEHADLHRRIAETGLVVSEMPLGAVPTARDFPRRNRLISGLSRGTLVVEAALRSGSLITARFAAEQGREVMAVPGSPLDPRARGSNQLLRDGAHLIESAEDVLRILSGTCAPIPVRGVEDSLAADGAEPDWLAGLDDADDAEMAGRDDATAPDDAEPAEPAERILSLLSPTPVSSDELARHAGLPAGSVSAALMELELSGRIARLPGGLVQLCPSAC